MIDKTCPKCHRVIYSPQWHISKDKCTRKKGGSISHSEDEHMHYYCSCGYDFIGLIDEEN